MSYDSKKIELGREPIQIVELDLGWCANTYGVNGIIATGTPYDFNEVTAPYSVALNDNYVVCADATTRLLRVFESDGASWSQVGNSFDLSAFGAFDACHFDALSSNSIVFTDTASDNIRTLSFDGTNWSQVGSAGYLGSAFTTGVVAVLSSTRVVVFTQSGFRAMDWTGATWAYYSYTFIHAFDAPSFVALNSTDFAFVDESEITTYRLTGLNWAKLGNSLTVSFTKPDAKLIGANEIIVVSESGYVNTCSWDGADWAETGTTASIGAVTDPTIAYFTNGEFAVIETAGDSLTYYAQAASTCTATGAVGSECFNTRASCQDPDNYNATTKTYRFCQSRSNLPVGVNMIPSINKDIARAPASTTGGKGLGSRAVVKVSLNDHSWHDRDVDPYVDTRPYDPETTGTYLGKLLARNPYFENREMRVLTGYLETPFSWDNFETEYYDITDMAGPHNGQGTITGKDVLVRTYGNKAKYPAISTGSLLADITDVATTATLTPTGVGDLEYPASGTISVGKEAMSFTRTGDALTLTRAQWGTSAVDHSAGDAVQICAAWTDTNVLDVMEELLVTGAGIPAAYIPNATGENWETERSMWMSSYEVTSILMRPEPIDKLIGELSSVFLFDVWWSAKDQEIRVKALSPEIGGASLPILTDECNIIKNSLTIKKDSKQRVSEVQVFYDKIDFSTKDEPTGFKSAYISTDPASTGSTMYGSNAIMTIYSRWFSKKEQASQLAGRVLARFVDTPSIVSFEVDMKDDSSVNVSERVALNTAHIQDFTGANLETAFQVTKVTEKEVGSTLKVEGLSSSFSGRYWFISPDGIPDYSSANEDQKRMYAFICYDTGLFLDGEEAYKII